MPSYLASCNAGILIQSSSCKSALGPHFLFLALYYSEIRDIPSLPPSWLAPWSMPSSLHCGPDLEGRGTLRAAPLCWAISAYPEAASAWNIL